MAPNVLKPILVRCRFNRVSFDVSAAWLPAATTHYPWAGTQRSIGDKLPEQGAFDRVPLADQDLVGLRVGDHFGTPGKAFRAGHDLICLADFVEGAQVDRRNRRVKGYVWPRRSRVFSSLS